jgi:arginase
MRIALFVVPYDAGRRSVGVGLGPAALLDAGAANELREAGHEVREATVEVPDETPPHELARAVAAQRELGRMVRGAVANGELPIVFAGNCHTAVGTLSGRPANTAVVWFDAHADFNTAASTTTGMLDGMALSMVTGRELQRLTASVPGFVTVPEDRVVLVGARDLDAPEVEALRQSAVTRVSARNAPQSIADAVRKLGSPAPSLYIHLDLDVLDPRDARANQYAAPAGLSPQSLVETLRAITAVATIYAVAITAYDPSWDRDGRARQAAVDALRVLVPGADVAE